MISLNLRGGLGNQIIQIGAAINKNKDFRVNTVAYDLNPLLIDYRNNSFNSRILEKCGLAFRFLTSKYKGKRSDFDACGIMDGYFQAGIQSDVVPNCLFLNLCKQLEQEMEQAKKYDLVIHYRGGDYLDPINKKIFELIDEKYYKLALMQLADTVDISRFNVQIITNDVQAAEAVFSGFFDNDFKISSGSEIDDFCTLIKSSFAIIPNSTFSLTARIIASKMGLDKGTYYPSNWFTKSSRMYGPKINEFVNVEGSKCI
ncbi:O-fucosyltransferase family protein [Shewanella fidelis]|uniref:Uncharacterized protein n=1 Tax=Shewanella fidelis TaxID=173509 RepID=A0AAW8NPX8_9GAMM|nr:hypothetical protein [Shewanella fidelis]MDR8524420.1 hypothetical protein [Shewanella fidelis]MDW4811896.1 hypothetical protein [Shewanella fidelis]MDW4817165.1 hypothetical protein [Shewanella fidelis]MDW4821235.1 hypothetical protein [Shewanella fidelis]MDW4822502.1 hypothetical protein [Shewanella fidelis]